MTPDPNEPALVVDEPAGDGVPGSGEPVPPVVPRRSGSNSRWLREGLLVVLVAVLVAVLLRAFVVQTFYIPSGSMEPTLQVGDRILVNKLSYHLHPVGRGDIVVFGRPAAENCGGPEVNDLVKRVIGLPGDTVTLAGGYVYIDGRKLNESWLPASVQGKTIGFWENQRQFFSRFAAKPGGPVDLASWPAGLGSAVPGGLALLRIR